MVWIFLAVLTFLMMSLLLTEEALLDDLFFGHAFRNSPFVIQRLYGMTAVFGCLMVTAFVNSAATRDFSCNTYQLIFTKPISKRGYLLGRFLGATLVSLIPMFGASIAVFISQAISPGEQWGPTDWFAHWWSIATIAIPNTFFIAAVGF
jgi:ABC-type transport system involved in multi-copper enzyme maturation permease subunit